MKRIIFYTDNVGFGGHEDQTVEAAKYLCSQPFLTVGFIFYEGNRKLYERLSKLTREGVPICLFPIKICTKPLQNFRTPISFSKIHTIKHLLNRFNPDMAVISPGNMELCSLGLVAAKKSGYHTVSYIPQVDKLSSYGIRFGELRDILNEYYYLKLPDHFITTTPQGKQTLIDRGASCPISVVNIALDLKRYRFYDKQISKAEYATQNEYLIGLIGRIHFHKGHDFLVQSFAKYHQEMGNIKLLIVGDGPDLGRLKHLVASEGLSNSVAFVPWMDDLSPIYSGLDMLIIPSRFDTGPLVMLEAMYFGVPIVCASVGLSGILPPQWVFPVADTESFLKSFMAVRYGDFENEINKNKLLIEQEFAIANLGPAFLRALSDNYK
ncbi:MAG: glycosyltransferase [Candidatus Helarchaeota archaeon]|nr:glycosyltransferase [Candidatus Helarchaeota archaeon]